MAIDFNTWSPCQMEPNLFYRWFECHPGLGSWVQGLGTLLAIIFAALAPFIHDWWRERRDQIRVLGVSDKQKWQRRLA